MVIMEQDKKKKNRSIVDHEAIALSQALANKASIRISFVDGEYLIDRVKWYTSNQIGLDSGKIVNKGAIKYWETL